MKRADTKKANQKRSSPLLAWPRRLRKGLSSASSMVRGAVGRVHSGGTHLRDRPQDSLRLAANSNTATPNHSIDELAASGYPESLY